MELRQFTYVSMTAECGSFTKAAARLFISQPALSNYISKIEKELGVRLFDRSVSPMILTYAGEQYLKRARLIMEQMESINREMRDITGNMAGKLRLGFSSERSIYMLPQILAPFQARYPGIRVEVETGSGEQLVGSLRGGRVDVVFLPAWQEYRDIRGEKVSEEELVLVAAKGYLKEEYLLDRERRIVDWRKAAELPLITLQRSHALRARVDLLFCNADEKPDILLESSSNMLSCRLAAQGLGVTIVPEITLGMLKEAQELEIFHLSDPPVTWEVFALYRETYYLGEAEQALLEIAAAAGERKGGMISWENH